MSATIRGAVPAMAASDCRRPLAYSTGICSFLIFLTIVAGATVGACGGSALFLLRQPANRSSAALPPLGLRRDGKILAPKLAAAGAALLRAAPKTTTPKTTFPETATPETATPETAIIAAPGDSLVRVSSSPVVSCRAPPAISVPGISLPEISLAEISLAGISLPANFQKAAPPSAARPPPHPATGEENAASSHLAAAAVAALTARGDDLLRVGDIASARLYYERAAEAGSEEAAFRMAATFDPAFLSQIGARTMAGDPAKALYWYRWARQLSAANVRLPRASAQPIRDGG
jgi:hypothetical protein